MIKNNHFLDIIIPIYNTPEKYLICAINSIKNQKGINFNEIGIIVIDDCSTNPYKEYFFKKNFPNLDITYIKSDVNLGPGRIRQKAIDYSGSKYITFLDSDDEFNSCDSLRPIIYGMKQTSVDVIYTAMIQEYKSGDEIKSNTLTFSQYPSLHGLFIKKEFLINKKIRFHEELRLFEDTYFIGCIFPSKAGIEVKNVTYRWRYNPDSITQKKEKYPYEVVNFNELVKSNNLLYEYYNEFYPEIASRFIIQEIIEEVLILESSFFDDKELADKREEYRKMLADLYVTHKAYFDSAGKDIVDRIYELKKKELSTTMKNIIISKTFNDFINEVVNVK